MPKWHRNSDASLGKSSAIEQFAKPFQMNKFKFTQTFLRAVENALFDFMHLCREAYKSFHIPTTDELELNSRQFNFRETH